MKPVAGHIAWRCGPASAASGADGIALQMCRPNDNSSMDGYAVRAEDLPGRRRRDAAGGGTAYAGRGFFRHVTARRDAPA